MNTNLSSSELASYAYVKTSVEEGRRLEEALAGDPDSADATDQGTLRVAVPIMHLASLLATIDRLQGQVRK